MEEQAPKRKAKDNPWYRLATLNGEPSSRDDEVAAKNRVVWNRWMASRLSEGCKATLLEKGWTSEELTPFTGDELRDIETSTGLLMSENETSFSDEMTTRQGRPHRPFLVSYLGLHQANLPV